MAAATCYRHADRETGRTCTRCGKPACADCLRDAPVGSHCLDCIKAGRPPIGQRLRRWSATAGPVVTKALIAANVVVFIATTAGAARAARSSSLVDRLALFGPAVASGEWYRLLSAGFVHEGLLHIGFNMALLYQFGSMLEPAWGRARFVALYTASLLVGSFGAVLLTPNAFTVGASGAVFGLVGAAAVGMRQRGLSVWRSGIGPLLAINLAFTVLIPGISIGGHLGGLAGGAGLGAVMLRAPSNRRSTVMGIAVALVVGLAATAGAVAAARS